MSLESPQQRVGGIGSALRTRQGARSSRGARPHSAWLPAGLALAAVLVAAGPGCGTKRTAAPAGVDAQDMTAPRPRDGIGAGAGSEGALDAAIRDAAPPDALAVADPRTAPVTAVDLHVDLLYQVHFHGKQAGSTEVRFDEPGFGGLVLSLYVPDDTAPGHEPTEPPPELLAAARKLQQRIPGSISTWLAWEGRPPDVERLLADGVRIFGLAHKWHNDLADAATDPGLGHGGLTPAGEAAVRRIYAAGGIVDVAHLSDDAFADVARLATEAKAPILATHTACRALAQHPRNLTDEQIRQVARSGGLIGVTLHGPHLRRDGARVTSADWAAHVVHLIDVAGLEHVALGSDLDGGIDNPSDVPDSTAFPALARALAARGLGDAAIAAVLRDNAGRFLRSKLPPKP